MRDDPTDVAWLDPEKDVSAKSLARHGDRPSRRVYCVAVAVTAIEEILSTHEQNEEKLAELVERLKSRRVTPFVGAGLSAPFHYPGWTDFLIKQAAREEVGLEDEVQNFIHDGKYEEAAEAVAKGLGTGEFEDTMAREFSDKHIAGEKLTGAVAVLPRLARGPVVTTNFDHVLETAFRQAGRAFEREVWGAKVTSFNRALDERRRYLLKLHGDVDESTDRVLSFSEYNERYGDGKPLPALLKRLFLHDTLLFIGCGLGPDRTLKALKKELESNKGIRHYAIAEKPADTAKFGAKANWLSGHGIRVIWYPPGRHDLIEPLLEYLAEQAPVPKRRSSNRRIEGPEDPLLAHRTGFFGREERVREVLAFLNGEERLATVTAAEVFNVRGAPGIGKTEVCKEALQQYLSAGEKPQAWYVELAEATDETAVLDRLADTFGVMQPALREDVLGVLASSEGVLYLDNLEDALGDAAVRTLLLEMTETGGVRVLASSREELGADYASNIKIEELDEDSAVAVFQVSWEKATGKRLDDSDELRTFLREDLDCHALSCVLVGAQAGTYGSVEMVRDAWHT